MTIPFAVTQGGVVVRVGRCQSGMVEAQAGVGETAWPLSAKAGDMIIAGVVIPGQPPQPTLEQAKTKAIAYVADRRWQMEVGGVSFGGATIATDDRSKLLLFAATTRARQDPNYTTRWKTPSGWLDLDATTLLAVEAAVFAHVAAAFEWERTKAEAISAAETVEEVEAIKDSA